MRTVGLMLWFLLLAAVIAGCGEPKRYPVGKDTVASFGDGTWSILKTGSSSDGSRKLHLHCSETQETLVWDIGNWRQDGDWVYAIGGDGGYTVLNYRTGFHARYRTVEEAPAEYRAELGRLRRR